MAEENNGGPKAPPVKANGFNLAPVTIEISCNLNRSYCFPPAVDNLRGRWSIRNMGTYEAAGRGMAAMPDIPGLYVELDPRAGKARIYDPLELPKNKQLLDEICRVHKGAIGSMVKPKPEAVYKGLSRDEVASWLYWMRRAIDGERGWEDNREADNGPKAVMISGQLPPLADLEAGKFGKVRKDYLDPTARSRRMNYLKEQEADAAFADQ